MVKCSLNEFAHIPSLAAMPVGGAAAAETVRHNTCRQLLICFNRCRVNDRIMFSHAGRLSLNVLLSTLTPPRLLTSTFLQSLR